MNVNLCYRAFTDPAFRTTFLPHPSQHKWDITPVNQHVELDPGRSTQAHLYFIWNCDHENAMMMSSERVPRVVARAEFDASLDSGDVYQSKPHLYFNQKVRAQYSRTEIQPAGDSLVEQKDETSTTWFGGALFQQNLAVAIGSVGTHKAAAPFLPMKPRKEFTAS